MATIYITEYLRMPLDGVERVTQCGLEPALAMQTVAISVGSVQSVAFQPGTTFVRINADAACSVAFGTNPVATATASRLSPNSTELFGVVGGLKVAVITNT